MSAHGLLVEPFETLAFMRAALVACLALALTNGTVGTLLVLRRMSLDGDVLRLMYVEDRPVAEVAALLGVPAGTVKSRAYRARRLLRLALGESR